MESGEIRIKGDWKYFKASELDETFKVYPARCPQCKAPAILCISHIGNENYFRSDLHKDGCGLAANGLKINIPSGKTFCLADMFSHKDKPLVIREKTAKPDDAGNDVDIDEIAESVDNITTHNVQNLKICSSMYNQLLKMRLDDYIIPTLQVKDFLIDSRTIEEARVTNLSGKKMIVMARSNLSALDPPFERPREFVCLKDAYTTDPNQALYFLIRYSEASRDTQFRNMIFGNKSEGIEKDSHKYIVATGGVHLIYRGTYAVYEMDPVSTARLCFTNRRNPFYE